MVDAICTFMGLPNLRQCIDTVGCGSLHGLIFYYFSDFDISFAYFGILKIILIAACLLLTFSCLLLSVLKIRVSAP